MTLTKAHIADAIWDSQRGNLSRVHATDLLEAVLDEIKLALVRGEKLMISGFGTFETRTKNDRIGRNPQTGEPITIKGRRVVVFRASGVLRDSLR